MLLEPGETLVSPCNLLSEDESMPTIDSESMSTDGLGLGMESEAMSVVGDAAAEGATSSAADLVLLL